MFLQCIWFLVITVVHRTMLLPSVMWTGVVGVAWLLWSEVASSNLAHWMETLAIIATYSNREYQAEFSRAWQGVMANLSLRLTIFINWLLVHRTSSAQWSSAYFLLLFRDSREALCEQLAERLEKEKFDIRSAVVRRETNARNWANRVLLASLLGAIGRY